MFFSSNSEANALDLLVTVEEMLLGTPCMVIFVINRNSQLHNTVLIEVIVITVQHSQLLLTC